MKRRAFLKHAFAMTALPLAPRAQAGCGKVLLPRFPVHKQETPYTCGPASAKMVLEFLGHEVEENIIAEKMKTTPDIGTSHGRYIKAYNQLLEEYDTGLQAIRLTGADAKVAAIHASLCQGLPVVGSFLTENHFKPGTAVGHYCVFIGIDPGADTLTISNPFGYHEEVDRETFFRLMAWHPKKGDIPGVPWWKTPRLWLPRTLIVLKKAPDRNCSDR